MTDVRFVHSPRVGRIVIYFGFEEFAFAILLTVYNVTFDKPRFRAYNDFLFAVIENDIVFDFGIILYGQHDGLCRITRNLHSVRFGFEYDFFTPVDRNVTTLFYRLRFEFVAFIVVHLYIRTLVDIIFGRNNRKFALYNLLFRSRFGVEHHKRVRIFFRHRLTFAKSEERVGTNIIQNVQPVIYIGKSVFFARADHVTRQYVVELNVKHIFGNVFQQFGRVFVRPFKRSDTRYFFGKEKLAF